MKVKMKILAALLVFSFPSISAFADENQNSGQQQQLTQQEQDQINQQISQDKQKFQAAQAVNAKRMQVIKSCSQYLDDSLSPQSVAKLKNVFLKIMAIFQKKIKFQQIKLTLK